MNQLLGRVLALCDRLLQLLAGDGEIYAWCPWDDSLTRVEDGPAKVMEVAIGAKYRPELRDWLPARPVDGVECPACRGAGWREYPGLITIKNLVEIVLPGQEPSPEPLREVTVTAPGHLMICQDCVGLGWVSVADPELGPAPDPTRS